MRLKTQVPIPALLLLDEFPPLSRGQSHKVPTLQPAVWIDGGSPHIDCMMPGL